MRSETPLGAKIIATWGWAINVEANFVTIEGFDINGPDTDSHTIQCNDFHHFTVRGCRIHSTGGSCISICGGDFYTIEDNICFAGAAKSWYSGISIYHPLEKPGETPANGFRIVIRNNVCYDNWTGPTGAQTDGNGIILDDFRNNHEGTPWEGPSYPHKTLVENNLCFRNGMKGISVNMSDRITLRRNTCFGNCGETQDGSTWRGDFHIQSSADCVVEGNIGVADPTTHRRRRGNLSGRRHRDTPATSGATTSRGRLRRAAWPWERVRSTAAPGPSIRPAGTPSPIRRCPAS